MRLMILMMGGKGNENETQRLSVDVDGLFTIHEDGE
jgi:hypothetical protein